MKQVPILSMALLVALASLAAAHSEHDSTWIDRRIQQWQPTVRERRWESIGWAKDIRNAELLAREHRRLVFLFTHDGRLNAGRC